MDQIYYSLQRENVRKILETEKEEVNSKSKG